MAKKLKINMLLYNPGLGGGDRVASIYAKYLQEKGHEVNVTALKRPKHRPTVRLKHFLRTGKHIKTGFTTAHFDDAGVNVNVVAEKERLDDNDIPNGDILIATYWRTAEWTASMSHQKGAKTYFVQNYESAFPNASPERVDATYKMPLNKIVISKWLDALMREKFGEEPVANIANSVDTNQFYAKPRNKNPSPRIGFLYSGNPIKGVDVTLAAIKRLKKTIPDLQVLAFGANRLTNTLPLPPNSEFHYKPPQDKIRDLYAKCDAWLCGSRVEGFHLPPMEAMACRCPVVSTKVGGPEDVIEDGVQGFLVPKEDSTALADKALSVLQLSDSEWRRMSDAAYETATRYTWDDAGALFEKTLFEIAAGEGRISPL